MAKTQPIVDHVSGIDDAPSAVRKKPLRAVEFRGGESAYLDMSEARSSIWAEVLRSLHAAGQPAYIEIDPKSRIITQLLLPEAMTVESIKPAEDGDGMEVELVISHARHVLSRQHGEYARLLRVLQDALKNKTKVWVTSDLNTQEIVDVRPAPKERKRRR